MNDLVIEVLKVLLSATLTGGGFLAYVAVKKDRREAKRDAPRDTVTTLEQLLSAAESASVRAAQALERAGDAETRAALADRRAERAEQAVSLVETRLRLVLDHVRPLVRWLDSGAAPPPPVVSSELRKLLFDLGEVAADIERGNDAESDS